MPPVIRTAPRTVTLENTFRNEERVMTFTCGSQFRSVQPRNRGRTRK